MFLKDAKTYPLVQISHSTIFPGPKNCTKRGPPVNEIPLLISLPAEGTLSHSTTLLQKGDLSPCAEIAHLSAPI